MSKSAMQELIDKIKTECSSAKITEEQNYILIWAIYIAEGLLEKEKELACQFAQEYINGKSYDTLRDYYDEKFELQTNL